MTLKRCSAKIPNPTRAGVIEEEEVAEAAEASVVGATSSQLETVTSKWIVLQERQLKSLQSSELLSRTVVSNNLLINL